MALKLSKAGYGSPVEILNWPTDLAIDALEYESFTQEYEEAFIELNKDKT